MDAIHLELIVETGSTYNAITGIALDLPVHIHVHKYTEQFLYLNSIRDVATPIAYIGNPQPDSWKNLLIINKSHTVVANSPRLLARERKIDRTVSTAYSSMYSSILATDQSVLDSKGKEKPLFYQHILPEDTVEASVQIVSEGHKELVEEGYQVDIEAGRIYTNYKNAYDPNSGSSRLYFVTSAASDGTTENTLLNAEPAVKEATWEDIDLTTGELVDDYPLYTKERSGRGYTYYFNKGARWFIKNQDKGLIQPLRPRAKRPDAPWYLRFTNGDVTAVVNDAVHRYRIPEFSTQPFIPYSPILFGNKEDLLFVNKRILSCTRNNLSINPTLGLHLTLFAEDEEGNLMKVYTTDSSLEAVRYSDTDVFYESDKISSWDNPGGFIALATNLFPNWKYYAQYYYEANDYEYTLVNLNPVTNKRLRDHTYVFYCVPDVNDDDRAIHYLLVDNDGYIVECSQTLGLGHPNLQLKNSDSSYNSNTVIGSLYFSETEDSFLSQYGAGFNNTNAYMILAEVCGIDSSVIEDQIVIDVRRPGASIVKSYYETAIRSNPRILQSALGYGPDGQTVPEINVVVIEPSLNLLVDYGGLLETDEAERALRTHMPASGYAVINWVYPKSTLSGYSFSAGNVHLDYTWEGVYTYRIYRRDSGAAAWELLSTSVSPARAALTYTDLTAVTGQVYDYAIAIVENDIEYPLSDILTVRVK